MSHNLIINGIEFPSVGKLLIPDSDGNKIEFVDSDSAQIPDGYILPTGSKTITANGTHDVSAFAEALVNVPIPDDYVSEQYGLTKARRITFNVTSANGVSTEASPLLSFTPEFAPKVVLFNISVNQSTSNALQANSTYTTLVSSFWIDSSILPIATTGNNGRKAGVYLYSSNKVNVSRNNIGFEYSANTNKIFLVQASNGRVAPMSATDGYYELLYWG